MSTWIMCNLTAIVTCIMFNVDIMCNVDIMYNVTSEHMDIDGGEGAPLVGTAGVPPCHNTSSTKHLER